MEIDRGILERITPGAQTLYRQTFENLEQLQAFGILESKLRAEHFLAQVLHETGGLRLLVENLNYSARRITEVWPNRFPSEALAAPYAHNSRALANRTYGGRIGNVEPNDGWRYIGRGLLQITGRANYSRVGAALHLDLLGYPTLVLDPEYGLRVAGEVWTAALGNQRAEEDSLEKVTQGINGGLIGLAERRAWLQKVRTTRVVK